MENKNNPRKDRTPFTVGIIGILSAACIVTSRLGMNVSLLLSLNTVNYPPFEASGGVTLAFQAAISVLFIVLALISAKLPKLVIVPLVLYAADAVFMVYSLIGGGVGASLYIDVIFHAWALYDMTAGFVMSLDGKARSGKE